MKMHPSPKRSVRTKSSSGFTLLEVMMVVVILGVLIGIGVTQFNPKAKMDKAKEAATRAAISQLHQEVITYEMENNKYPASLQSLVDEGMLTRIKPDGWGKPFQYNASTGEITSPGGGSGKAISSKDL